MRREKEKRANIKSTMIPRNEGRVRRKVKQRTKENRRLSRTEEKTMESNELDRKRWKIVWKFARLEWTLKKKGRKEEDDYWQQRIEKKGGRRGLVVFGTEKKHVNNELNI